MKNLINRASLGAKKTNYLFKARWLQGAASANESKKMQVNPRKSLLKEGLSKDESSTRLRVDYVSFTSRLRVWQVISSRMAAVFLMLLTLSIGNAWGAVNNGDLFERISAAPSSGDEVIIVNSGETVAMSTTQNSNNRGQTTITTSSHQYIYASTNNAQVLTVKVDGTYYGFHTSGGSTGGFLQQPSNKNYLWTTTAAYSTTLADATKWSLSVSSSVFTITSKRNKDYMLQYNSSSSIFASYKSTSKMKDPSIYKKVMSAPTAVAASSITSSGATITVTDATNVNNYELYYSTSSTAPTASSTATTTITGGKSKTLTGLTASTTYYVWARAFSTSPARKTGWIALTGNTFATSSGGGGSCETPTFDLAVGTYCGSQSVTISSTTTGSTIYYTTDNSTPTTSSSHGTAGAASATVTVSSSQTLKAIAVKDGLSNSATGSAAYTITPLLTTMDDIFTKATAVGSTATTVCVTFDDWVVSGASSNGRNVYVTDGTKGFIIYGGSDTGFRQGNILSGTVTCNVQLYNGAAELTSLTTSTTGLTVTTGGTVTPTVMNSSEIAALTGVNTGRVITTTGECESCNSTKQCINGAQLFNQLYSYSATTGTTYTVTGVYLQYNDVQEILPLGALTTFTITAVSNNVSYGTVSLTGSVITATPESGYRVSTTTAYTVTSGTATVTDNGDGTFTVTPSSDCTVRINFEATPTHNIIFNTGGLVTISNATVYEGDTYDITETPAASLTEDCEYSTFVGWTTSSSIADESVRPSLVTSVEMGVSNVTLYAVYSKTEEGGGSGDYELVEEDLGTGWAGDYLIAFSSTIFADGRVAGTGTGGIGQQSNQVNPDTYLSGKVVDATWGNTYYVTLEEISSGSNTYVLKTQDGNYNYQSSNKNGLTSTATKATAANYPITVTYTSSSDIKLCLGGDAEGAVFRWNDAVIGSGGQVFRFYKDCGQEPIYLYKKSSGTRTYSLDANCSAPTIIPSPKTINFEDKGVGSSSTMTFTVRGSNLTNNISLAISGTDAAMFSIDKSTLTQTDGSVVTTTVTVTYSPTSTGSHSAQINLTSSGAITKTVTLTGTGKWAVTWMVDGEVYETTLVANASRPSFPDNPDSFDATSSEFYGWSTTEWKGRIDDLTDKTVYTSNSSMATVNTSGRTYYAVFAKPKYAEGSAPVNTVLWAEDFSGFGDTDVPNGDITNSHTGTTVYGDNTVTYTCVNGGSNTQLHGGNETLYAGGVKPELLVGKNTGTFTVAGIPSGGSSVLTVSYKQNNKSLTVTASGTGYSGSNTANTTATQSFDVNVGSVSTFTLTFAATTTDNVRLDDIEVIVKTRSVTYSRYMTNSREDMYVTSAKDIMTQASMTMAINRSAIKSGSVTIADVAGSQGGAFHAVITNGTANASTGLNATVEIQYTPTKANVSETATMTVEIGAADTYTFTVYGRSLPAEFAIVGKVGVAWTALPADGLISGLQAGYGLTVNSADNPTEATLAPEASLFKYYARTTKGNDYIRLAGAENNQALWSSTSNGIKVWAAIGGGSATGDSYEWKLATTDNVTYTLWNKSANSGAGRNLGINNDKKWGMHATPATDELRFLPVTSTAAYIAMTVTNWGTTSFTFTTGDVIPSYSSITVLYDDDSYSATMSGSGPYTLNIPGIDFSAHSGEQLVLQWKDGSGNPVAQGAVITPIFITSANTNFAGYADLDMLSNCDVLVKNGAMLTITTNNLHVRNLTVEGGSTLNISGSGITFYMNSLSLRGGWTTIDDEQTYDMPRVYINPASTLTKTVNAVNFDISVDKRNYYPFAVPFPVTVSAVDFANSTLAGASTYGTHYVIKEYDGDNRAKNGTDDANWKIVEDGTIYGESSATLQPGRGYILTAVSVPAYGGGVIRFPMSFTGAWTTKGEQATVSDVTKNAVSVTAYSGTAATADKRHAGWNLLGVPYMSCFASSSASHSEGSSAFITGKMELTGDPADPYDWDEDGDVYVTVPVHDFSEYLQYNIAEDDTKLLPGWCFFVQFAKSGTLTFATAGQEDSGIDIYAPKRAVNESPVVKTGIILSDGDKSDKTTLIISDRYSADYEVGADLEKMFGNGYTLATYSLSQDARLAYNAMSTTDAKKVIPIGFRAPEDGEYTFSLNPRYAESAVERVDLIDYQTGEVTNLMMSNYTFSTERTQDDERFALNVVPMAKVPTGVDDVNADSEHARKIILDDKMYIIYDGLMYDATGKRVTGINK